MVTWTTLLVVEVKRMSDSECVVKTELTQQDFLKDWICEVGEVERRK